MQNPNQSSIAFKSLRFIVISYFLTLTNYTDQGELHIKPGELHKEPGELHIKFCLLVVASKGSSCLCPFLSEADNPWTKEQTQKTKELLRDK